MRKLLLQCLDFIFPMNCSCCSEFDLLSRKIGVCRNCINLKQKLPEKLCINCKTAIFGSECPFCNSRNVFFEKLIFIRARGEIEKLIVQKLKFSPKPQLGNFFRIGLNRALCEIPLKEINFITWIPSNKSTSRTRPISSFDSIVTYISNKYKIDRLNCLQKNSSDLQSGKSYRERFFHARFSMDSVKLKQGEINGSVLLVDDVFTTGATINEGARILLEMGATKVYVLVLTKSFPDFQLD